MKQEASEYHGWSGPVLVPKEEPAFSISPNWSWQDAMVGIYWQRTYDYLEVWIHPLPFVSLIVTLRMGRLRE